MKTILIITLLTACSLGFTITQQKNTTLKFVPIKKTCTNCRKAEVESKYKVKIHIAKNDLGFVRVRKDASCFEVGICDVNVIEKINDNLWVYAMGPVKNAEFSAGIAYIIRIKDINGKFWKGYLSATVIDSILFQ